MHGPWQNQKEVPVVDFERALVSMTEICFGTRAHFQVRYICP